MPGLDLLDDGLGDVVDRLVGQLHAQGAFEVIADVAHRHPAGVEADDLLIQPAGQTPGTLGHQPRLEAGSAIPRRVQANVTDLGRQRLRRRAVTAVRRLTTGRVALVIAEVIGQLGLQHALEDGLDQPRQEAALGGQPQPGAIDMTHQLIEPRTVGQRLGQRVSRDRLPGRGQALDRRLRQRPRALGFGTDETDTRSCACAVSAHPRDPPHVLKREGTGLVRLIPSLVSFDRRVV